MLLTEGESIITIFLPVLFWKVLKVSSVPHFPIASFDCLAIILIFSSLPPSPPSILEIMPAKIRAAPCRQAHPKRWAGLRFLFFLKEKKDAFRNVQMAPVFMQDLLLTYGLPGVFPPQVDNPGLLPSQAASVPN